MRILPGAIALVGLLTGCNDAVTADQMVVTFAAYSMPVTVDTFCDNGGCNGEEEVAVTVAFEPDLFLAEGTRVQFEQYRVDYQVDGIGKQALPYFASPVSIMVYPDQTASFILRAAGNAQRQAVYDAVGSKQMMGSALLTLAGYDNLDEQVLLEKSFEISFGDFLVAEAESDGSATP